MLPHFFIVIALLAAVPFAGCAEKSFASLRPGLEDRGHYIEGVPFYRQQENYCGPAALDSLASFWGERVSMEEIVAAVYLPELRGTLPMDMERFMRAAGFETASSTGTLDELKAHVRKNEPVICLLDLGFGLYRQPHYVVAIGFDDVNKVIIVHDGLTANKVIEYEKFAKAWARAGNWMLLALPKTPRDKGGQ